MKLVRSKVEILDKIDGNDVIKRIATVARTSHKSEDLSTPEKDLDLVKRLIEWKHDAVLEFFDITVKFTCSRAIANEIVRHRMASYNQESTRYCNYAKDKFNNELTFIIPTWLDIPEGNYTYWNCNWVDTDDDDKILVRTRTDSGDWLEDDDTSAKDNFLSVLAHDEECYVCLTKRGWSAEKAREVLPLCTKTELNMKANLREWRHFFKLRCAKSAHPDIRTLALDLLKQFHEKIPVIFDDLYTEFYDSKI